MKKYHIDFSIGDADFFIRDIEADTPRKAKYQAYKILKEQWRIHKNIDLSFIDFIRFAHACEVR